MIRATKVSTLALLVVVCLSITVVAQTPATPPAQAQTPAVPTVAPKAPVAKPAPQVVTVLHRLNGLKMFRMLMRSEQNMISKCLSNDLAQGKIKT